MDLLTVLIIINFVLLLIVFFSRGSTRMTYTESIVARQMSAYAISFLTLMVMILMLFPGFSVVQLAGLIVNLLLLLGILVYFLTRLMKRFPTWR